MLKPDEFRLRLRDKELQRLSQENRELKKKIIDIKTAIVKAITGIGSTMAYSDKSRMNQLAKDLTLDIEKDMEKYNIK